jgi:argininosuccinate lyase
MRRNAERGFSTATELADELTRISDMSFREAHAVVGRMVAKAIERGKNPQDITLEDLIEAHVEVLGKKVEIDETKLRDALNAQKFVEARNLPGGPSPKEVKRQISRLKKLKQRLREATKTKLKQIEMADERLLKLFKF